MRINTLERGKPALDSPFMLATCALALRALAKGNTTPAQCDFAALNLLQQFNGAGVAVHNTYTGLLPAARADIFSGSFHHGNSRINRTAFILSPLPAYIQFQSHQVAG